MHKFYSKLRMRKILWYWSLEDEKMEILMWGVNVSVSASGGEQDTKNADKESLEISSSSTEEMNLDWRLVKFHD